MATELTNWSRATGAGIVLPAPGVNFAEDDTVAPDIVWVSLERLRQIAGSDRKLHAAPELVGQAYLARVTAFLDRAAPAGAAGAPAAR